MSLGEGVDGAGSDPDSGSAPSFGRRLVDAFFHAVALALLVTCVSAAVSFALGGRWVGVKFLLFVVGFLALGVGGLFLRPTPAWRDTPYVSRDPRGRTPLESAVDRLLGRYALAPEVRLPSSARVLIAGVLMLVTSYLMETVFDVAL
jgi:hypothetical protein